MAASEARLSEIETLAAEPDHDDARHNREIVQKLLEQQELVHQPAQPFDLLEHATECDLGPLVDGIEQLETYFGRYLPQLLVAGLAPLVIFGFALGAFSTLTMSLLFELVPNSFHGRVMSLVVLCWGFTAFGNILTGLIAELFSTPISIAMAGTYMCICGILVYIFLPSLRKI